MDCEHKDGTIKCRKLVRTVEQATPLRNKNGVDHHGCIQVHENGDVTYKPDSIDQT